jgi:glycosyltransferase involved in cell wall biosynthesis
MKTLFVLPRFHTNLHAAIRALQDDGGSVHLLCRESYKVEDHADVRPTLLDDSPLSFARVGGLLHSVSPDLAVLRRTRWLSRLTYWHCLSRGRPCVGYDQRPYLAGTARRRLLRDILGGQPVHRLTPVYGRTDGASRPDPWAAYVPLPVRSMPEGETRPYAPDGVVRILCVGKLVQPRKRHLLLLEALERLAPELRFLVTLVGQVDVDVRGHSRDYLDRLRDYVRHGPLTGRITLREDVPYAEMPHIYRSHDVCVLPSTDEPLSIAPFEAMGYGCVPVVSSVTGTAGCLEHSGGGLLFRSGDVEDLARILRGLLARPAECAALGARALDTARTEYGPDRFLRRFRALARTRGVADAHV